MFKYPLFISIIFLTACEDRKPIKVPSSKSEYFGVWHYYNESRLKGYDLKATLLAINSDSSIIYKDCSYSKTQIISDKANSSSSRGNSTVLPSAFITGFSKDKLSIQQKVWITSIDFDLIINKEPYQLDGRWQMVIDNTVLSKLRKNEINKLTSWVCPENKDEDEDKFGS
ncbi:MAG: hypothetical protein OQK98_12450 [Gammaproteobacteria bacterium]|nr:hypothetical protein [Gammaproteobacteria bacterium]